MSDDNYEQITKVPDAKPAAKTKDPKKVAAGKKLAELNKKAKDALAREMKREANSEDSGESWLPELSFSTVLTVVGIGVTTIDLFFRFYTSKTEKDNYDLTLVHMTVKTSPEPARKKFLYLLEMMKLVNKLK